MGYLWQDLHDLKSGQAVEIDVSASVNVKLMSYDSFSFYRQGHSHRYYGGRVLRTPCRLPVPYDGPWILVVDLSYPGTAQVKSVRILTEQELNKTDEHDSATIDIEEKEAQSSEPGEGTQIDKAKIFIVHGHDNELKETVARFIEKLDFEAVILHEQANKGKTIIEKLETNMQDIQFAVILYSPDDEMKDGKKRARQNVVFEHGLFVGKLTRAKVVAIYKSDSDIEDLSDLSGVIYIKYESGWQQEVARELRAAGLTFDANKLL